MKLKRVVVTGIGTLTPIGNSLQEYWDNLLKGVSGATCITKFDASKFKTQFACEIKDFDISKYLDRKEARKLDPFAQYAIATATDAIKDSDIDISKINLDRAGVIWGTGIGGFTSFISEVSDYARGDGTPKFNPFFIPKIISDIAPGHISMIFGFRGPNYATSSACASAANAIADAFNMIRLGKADLFISGGSEAGVNDAGVGGFNALHALSTRNDDPTTASRPFDKDRDGFVVGEGAAALILEEYEHAKARGAKIYAEMVGTGLSADAHHITAPHPEGLGAMMAMKNAMDEAEISYDLIDHINTHGTSTPVGDIAEPKAIVALFGEHAYKINLNSTKSMTGHLLGAAAAIEAIVCCKSIQEGKLHPTINLENPDPECDLDYVPNVMQHHQVEVAVSNSLGFGGHNGVIVLKKYQ